MKTNKQGVRDLDAMAPAKPSDFGKYQMPGELASKLLSEQPAEYGPALDPVVQEFLQILAEECGETVQRVTKILRFGFRRNPWDGKDNVERLESEIGDICAVLDVLEMLKVIDSGRIYDHTDVKLLAFIKEENPARPRIRHMTPALRALIEARVLGSGTLRRS